MKKIIFLLLLSVAAKAQQYIAEAPLHDVQKEGFYEISLPPRVTALVKDDYRNLRINDEKGTEISYIRNIDRMEYVTIVRKEFKIEKILTKGCCTSITLINDDKSTIDNFILEVKNADVAKTAILRGSDDNKTWYALKERFYLEFGRVRGKVVTEVFDFPLSDYKYYQLTIDDSTTSPLNVVAAWQVAPDIVRGRYVGIPSVKFTAADSSKDHTTWVSVQFDTAQYVNKIELGVQGPHLYRRQAAVFRKAEYFDRKKRKRTSLEEVGSFEIISGQVPMVLLAQKESELLIRVDNEDNQPLKFNDIRAYQLKQSIVAWLEPDHKYKLVFGNDLQVPVYDLEYFRDSIPASITKLDVGQLFDRTALKEATEPSVFSDRRLIWAAIIFVIALLGLMSYRMLGDKNLNE